MVKFITKLQDERWQGKSLCVGKQDLECTHANQTQSKRKELIKDITQGRVEK